ncbi:fatty acid hydroxylase [Blastopirellula marina]|uniref:Fatty acid hydroxylase n=1 Tax=Blastopirellula marina TaxID=124 RepID=A0A2S8FM63_9BACT|nr:MULTISPECIES: sterol desaturase family protein [Pirellulaceae]PQO33241.1 fatty acid hydroxylase [Blastopirellula marina]RCS52330.1 sterol desaturase family protein [Bremerella cremea]
MSASVEMIVRLACFLGVFTVMAVWELFSPRRVLKEAKGTRWLSNLALVVINTIAVRLLLPITAMAAALFAESRQWGVLTLIAWPLWVEVILSVLLFDLAIYLQHVMFHAVPLFWRLHKVHHADMDIDVTTGLRFHTLEILLSAVIKLGVVVLLGPPAIAVVLFEVLLNGTSMFNHSNVRLPAGVDRIVRCVLVTPDMHRVHHSVLRRETNSNFGFNLPWWDFLLGTYIAQPSEGHDKMDIGLAQYRDPSQVERLPGMLLMPLDSEVEESR